MKRSMILMIMIVILLALAVAPALAAPVAVTVPATGQQQTPAELCAYSIWYRPTCDRQPPLAARGPIPGR